MFSGCFTEGTSISTVSFIDASEKSNISHSHKLFPIGELIKKDKDVMYVGANVSAMLSGGVAAGDIDNDGLIDLYFIGGYKNENYLYRNLGAGVFEDISEKSNLGFDSTNSNAPTFVDINADGYLDLFVGGIDFQDVGEAKKRNLSSYKHQGPPRIFINQHDLSFTEETNLRGVSANINTYSSVFGDIDLDGDLDLFTTHWTQLGFSNIQHLWKNNGKGFFYAADFEAGLAQSFDLVDRTMTPIFSDLNNDGYPDIVVTGDFETSQVFLNTKRGGFVNATNPFEIDDENGMGASVGDFDNDGDFDWFVTGVKDNETALHAIYKWGASGNRLYQNQGDGSFKNITESSGVRDGGWGWASCFSDFNQDGFLDIFHVNGYGHQDEKVWYEAGVEKFFFDSSRLFINNKSGSFIEQSKNLGIVDKGNGRGVVCTDIDNDGDIDIVISNYASKPKVFLNTNCDSKECNYLKVKLIGVGKNTAALGAKITLITASGVQTQEINSGNNYLSHNPALAHFFSEKALVGEKLKIEWPDKAKTITRLKIENDQGLIEVKHPDLKDESSSSGVDSVELTLIKGLSTLLNHSCKEDVVWVLQKIHALYPNQKLEAYIKKMLDHHSGSELEKLINPSVSTEPEYNENAEGLGLLLNYTHSVFFNAHDFGNQLLKKYLSEDKQGYILTHQFLALAWGEEQRNNMPKDLLAHKTRLLKRILDEHRADPIFHDLYTERAAILMHYMNEKLSIVEIEEWVKRITISQLSNGQWEGGSYQVYTDYYGTGLATPVAGKVSDQRDHTTVLAIWVLAKYLHMQRAGRDSR